jgi:imidazolonepropionase
MVKVMQQQKWDALWINAVLTTCENGYGIIAPGAIAVKDNKIAWLGSMSDLPGDANDLAEKIYDVKGCCLTPGFIDCHTHLVYAGNRAQEFERRLQGVSYEDIARQGGGIQSTVNATRAASDDELLTQSLVRAKALMDSGVTVMEIKSGYGLDRDTELKILRVAKKMGEVLPLTVVTTYLGAHTIPIEFAGKADHYIDFICDEMIPEISQQKLASMIDVFCEKIAFNLQQTERVFAAAEQHGLKIKCHAEQLSHSGSVPLAVKYHALSVDHLEHAELDDIMALKQSHAVAVLLPGAFYFLRETKLPPIELLREHNIPLAIASDCNPGTSPVLSLLLILNMACTLFRFTPEEALLAVTKYAAQALGLEKNYGTLAVNKMADFAVWDIKHPAELAYYLGGSPLMYLVREGEIIIHHTSPL